MDIQVFKMKSQKNPFMVLAGEKGGVMTVKYS
jgi:uncharacterized protein YunC (DUF1805 family)